MDIFYINVWMCLIISLCLNITFIMKRPSRFFRFSTSNTIQWFHATASGCWIHCFIWNSSVHLFIITLQINKYNTVEWVWSWKYLNPQPPPPHPPPPRYKQKRHPRSRLKWSVVTTAECTIMSWVCFMGHQTLIQFFLLIFSPRVNHPELI